MDSQYELYRWDDQIRRQFDWSHLWDGTAFCRACGVNKNLIEVITQSDSAYHLCVRCKAEERMIEGY
jgi:hypothetical protein